MKIVKLMSFKEKKELLAKLIKQISDHYGGDEEEFLREYSKDVFERYKDDVDTAIDCFKNIHAKLI